MRLFLPLLFLGELFVGGRCGLVLLAALQLSFFQPGRVLIKAEFETIHHTVVDDQ